jgi:hypothetical protein
LPHQELILLRMVCSKALAPLVTSIHFVSVLFDSNSIHSLNFPVENQSAISNRDSEVQQNNTHEENNPFASESDNLDNVEDQGIVDDVDVIADVQLAHTFCVYQTFHWCVLIDTIFRMKTCAYCQWPCRQTQGAITPDLHLSLPI